MPKDASNSHASVRRSHATETSEDYVEAIADIISKEGECRLMVLAKHFAVSHVTVNRTLSRLERDALVERIPYGPITLTAAGKRLANASKKRHVIVHNFLLALGVSEATAAVDAEGIEHHASPETLQAMERFIKSHSKSK